MDEYIEKDAAIAALTEFRDDQTVSKYLSVENCLVARGAIERATKVLESLPAADVEPVQEWISVDERLPDDNDRVIAFRPNESETSAYKYCVMWGWSVKASLKHRGITHWMDMPQPPKGE